MRDPLDASRALRPFVDLHVGMLERFRRHRDLVIERDFAASARELAGFRRELRAHMRMEERHVLPLYAARVEPGPGGGADVFIAEHRNLIRNLDGIAKGFAALRRKRRPSARDLQLFLESEHLFIQILDHHDRRERNLLYPRLEAALAGPERRSLLEAAGLP